MLGLTHDDRVDPEGAGESSTDLEQLDSRLAQAVELRVYSGLLETEVAAVLGVSAVAVKRDWKVARAWLLARRRRPGVRQVRALRLRSGRPEPGRGMAPADPP